MKKIGNWFANTFWRGYTPFERAFLYGMILLQAVVFCIAPDSPLSVIAGIAGVLSVVMTAKGRIESYYIGFIMNFAYLYLSFRARLYGEVAEQIWYIATMIWGIFVWKKNMNENADGTAEVETKKFSAKQWVISAIGTVAATAIVGFILSKIGSFQPYTDAATNVLAIIAQLLMVRRYREQWVWWIVIDLICVKMWWVVGDWCMVAMYIAWTINCIYGWVNWTKLEKMSKDKVILEGE